MKKKIITDKFKERFGVDVAIIKQSRTEAGWNIFKCTGNGIIAEIAYKATPFAQAVTWDILK